MTQYRIHMMKKISYAALMTFTLLISVSSGVLAQPVLIEDVCNDVPAGQTKPDVCDDPGSLFGPGSLFDSIAQTLIIIIGGFAVIMIVIGGFRYVVSVGDQNAVQGAKNTILYAVIGLVVAISAQLILDFVLSNL